MGLYHNRPTVADIRALKGKRQLTMLYVETLDEAAAAKAIADAEQAIEDRHADFDYGSAAARIAEAAAQLRALRQHKR